MKNVAELRQKFHGELFDEVLSLELSNSGNQYPSLADCHKKSSTDIAWNIVNQLYPERQIQVRHAHQGIYFREVVRRFIEKSLNVLSHLQPCYWHYSTDFAISEFDQYRHLAKVEELLRQNAELAIELGNDYIVTPDIVISRFPVKNDEVKHKPSLHASISCKWTLRSDRSQNARTEALNLIRHCKGHLPHIVAVTAEPLPTRIASLALGTGDLDCVYHFALHELQQAILETGNEDQLDMLNTLVAGRRLRDISDLPFDLAV